MLYGHSHFSAFLQFPDTLREFRVEIFWPCNWDRIWVSAVALRGYSPDCSLGGKKPLFSSILTKILRSCNKAQCPARSKHHWVTSQQVGHRQHKGQWLSLRLAQGTTQSSVQAQGAGIFRRSGISWPSTGAHSCANPGCSWGCCRLLCSPSSWAELPAWALPCQGCQRYLSSSLQEPQRNSTFAVISVPLVGSTELGKRGEPCEQTDRQTWKL